MNDNQIIPSIKTDIEIITAYGTCIYIFPEEGKWDVTKEFKQLGGVYDGTGWLVKKEHKEEVEDICSRNNLVCFDDYPMPSDWESLRINNKVAFFEKQLELTERKIYLETNRLGITYTDVEELYSSDNRKKLEKTSDGINVIDQLYKYQKLQVHLTRITNSKRSKEVLNNVVAENNTEFDYLLQNNSRQKLIDDLQNISQGISTDYKIGDIDLIFPGGAISIVAAPTSHGKTTALINFTLSALEKNPDKTVYFFTYEESMASIMVLFINTWISKKLSVNSIPEISKNNRRSIESYFRSNTANFITSNVKDIFAKYEERFFSELIDIGRLKVIQSDMPSNELIQAMQHIKNNTSNLGMICIDYMQLLKLETNNRMSRQEELKEICLNIKDCAINTGLPIVIAAQFNRTVTTEADLSPVNIGEAGDIERIASLIIGMYNRNFEMSKEGNKDRDGKSIAKESAIYFEILKGRNVGNGHRSVMKFNGNGGTIINSPIGNSNPFE